MDSAQTPGTSAGDRPEDRSLGELVATATRDLSLLVHQEVELAKTEIKTEVVAAGKGAGLFGGAGFAGLFALIFLSISAAYGVSALGMPLGLGFFTVGALYLAAAAVLALSGKKKIGQVGPPEKTLETLKDDVAWAKHPTRTS
ncbi:MAG: phage holin family protein [Mycobacteriales bacterium]